MVSSASQWGIWLGSPKVSQCPSTSVVILQIFHGNIIFHHLCRVTQLQSDSHVTPTTSDNCTIRLYQDEEITATESLFSIGQKNFESVWRKSAIETYPCAYGVQSEPVQNSFLLVTSVVERISAVMEGLPLMQYVLRRPLCSLRCHSIITGLDHVHPVSAVSDKGEGTVILLKPILAEHSVKDALRFSPKFLSGEQQPLTKNLLL